MWQAWVKLKINTKLRVDLDTDQRINELNLIRTGSSGRPLWVY